MEEDLLRTAEAGFTKHLIKPISISQLMDAILNVTASRDP